MGVYQSDKATDIMSKVLEARGVELDGRTFHDWDEKGKPFWIPAQCSFGDYCGSLVEKTNIKAMQEILDGIEEEKGIEVYSILHEAYSTQSLCLLPRAFAFPEVVEALNSLTDYPLLDESLHSALELEAQAESWSSWAREDFKRELRKLVPDGFGGTPQNEDQTLADLPSLNPLDYPATQQIGLDVSLPWEPAKDGPDSEEIIDLLSEEEIDNLGHLSLQDGSHQPINEQGDSIHFYIEEMVKALSWEHDLLPYISAKVGSLLTR